MIFLVADLKIKMKFDVILKVLFFIASCLHFFIVQHFLTPFEQMYNSTQKTLYISSSILGFIILVLFYQLFPFAIKAFLEKNQKNIDFTKYTLFYFSLSILFFILTKPFSLSFHDCYYIIPDTDSYSINWFQNLISNILFSISKTLYPSVFSVSILCSFVYSLIFAYLGSNLKKECPFFFYFPLFFLCLPNMLLFSLVQYSQVFVSYLLCFVLLYIFFNKDKFNNSILKGFLLGFLSAIIIFMRIENIFMLVVLPLIIYFMKIFNKKSFITYILSIILFFTPLFVIQKQHENIYYELHNLAFTFYYYIQNNKPMPELEQNKELFYSVFPLLVNNSISIFLGDKIVTENFDNAKKVMNLMLLMTLKNSMGIAKHNIDKIFERNKHNDFLSLKLINRHYDNDRTKYWMENITNQEQKNKFISYSVYGNSSFETSKIAQIVYNPINYCALIFLTIIFGIFQRKKYFILSSVLLLIIFIQMLILMPIVQFFYFYPIIIIAPLLFILASILPLNTIFLKMKTK